jgi:tetratricopeptide (TPR) repeat protein
MRLDRRIRLVAAGGLAAIGFGCADIASLDWAGTSRDEAPVALDATDTQTTRTYLHLAVLREDAGDWEGALGKVDKALVHQPRGRAALLRRAQLLLVTADPDAPDLAEPREILSLATAEDGAGDADVLIARAWLAHREGNQESAVATAHTAIGAAADSARIQMLAARLFSATGETQAALDASERAIELDPDSGAALRERARARLRLADFDTSMLDLGTQLRRHGADVETRLLESDLYLHLGDPDRSRRALESIPATRRPPDAVARLGRFAVDAGKLDIAHAHLDAAVEAHPTHAALLDAMLALDEREGRGDASVARIQAARAARPDDVALARLEARALAAAGRNDDAGAAFARAVALDPNDSRSYEELLAWLSRSGSADTVERRAEALGLAPAPAHVVVAMSCAKRGDAAGARAAAEQAHQADPDLAIARATLARALAASGGDLDRAATLAREARAARPDDPDLAWTLGVVHLRRGQGKTAFEVLREAIGSYPPERPGYPELVWNAAQALDRAGDRTLAMRGAQIAIYANGDRKPEPSWLASARALAEPRAAKPAASAAAPAPTASAPAPSETEPAPPPAAANDATSATTASAPPPSSQSATPDAAAPTTPAPEAAEPP